MRFDVASIVLLFIIVTVNCEPFKGNNRSFDYDPELKTFLINGTPSRLISGSIHYFRIPSKYWNDRLKKIRACGFNAIQTYVDWSLHEPEPGVFDFAGEKNLEEFLQLAKINDLLVILRPGPYIDAERDMGGLPFWLLQKNADVKLRTSDPKYMSFVDRWFSKLMSRMFRFLFENGGPVIMMQVENEYGSYVLQTNFYDVDYVTSLRDMILNYLKPAKVFLFTTDGCGKEYLRSGKIPGVLGAVDFGPGDDPQACFDLQKLYSVHGPKFNPEFYSGWDDHWSMPHQQAEAEVVASELDKVLSTGANVNMYMIIGGSNFGFHAGSDDPPFRPSVTSSDYDAPIGEAGDLRPKYFAIKEVIKKYAPVPDIRVKNTTEKGHYGFIPLTPLSSLVFDYKLFEETRTASLYPKTFEELGQNQGIVLYETSVQDTFSDPAKLEITGLHDRAHVFVDGELQGILSRMSDTLSMPIRIRSHQRLQIFVENQGRICYGPNMKDFKGLVSNVTIGGKIITNWTMTGLPFSNLTKLTSELEMIELSLNKTKVVFKRFEKIFLQTRGSMTLWTGSFQTECNEEARDTFASLNDWHKGVLFVNGFNVGRYWPTEGPQQTLYVPATVLKGSCQQNRVVLLEQDRVTCYKKNKSPCTIEFVTEPIINGPVPSN